MNYHAHIYWQNEAQRFEALYLRQPLQELGCQLGNLHDEPIGPHPHAMYQVNYNSSNAPQVEDLLYKAKLHILLHEDTGDDLRDHTIGARWIGRPLTLDLKWLENYVRRQVNA
jgi:DOPA 4,5-dioxygenase